MDENHFEVAKIRITVLVAFTMVSDTFLLLKVFRVFSVSGCCRNIFLPAAVLPESLSGKKNLIFDGQGQKNRPNT